tara:strand:- start:229 stop:846 length:618 start_codon:yes stop_codon:yes gene_type:complete
MLRNIPIGLTLFRIAAIPGIVALLFLENNIGRYLACTLFGIAAITDFFDGFLARALNQQSLLGQFLDPIADKLLVAATLLMMTGCGQITGLVVLPAIVILCREILVSGLREFLAGNHESMPVSVLAKWKTTLQMFSIGFLIVGDAGPEFMETRLIGETGLWFAALLTLITGYDYLRTGLNHMDITEKFKDNSEEIKKTEESTEEP